MLFAMLAGTAVKVSANLPIVYEWAGRDNLSFKMLDGDFSKFLKLTCDDEEVDPINYTVSAENGNILTLKEEYLKTLANGTYSFTCYSSGEGVEIPMYGEIVDSPGPPYGIEFPSISAHYTLTRITCAGENMDPSYYTVTKDKGYNQVTFKEGAPPIIDFKAYFSAEYIEETALLHVDIQAPSFVEESTSDATADTSEESMSIAAAVSDDASTSDTYDENLTLDASDASTDSGDGLGLEADSKSKTGNNKGAAALTILVIVLVSVSGCVALGVVLLKRYRSKKERD